MHVAGRLPLLDALLALKPNAIYAMAPAKTIASAAAYFAEDPIRRFCWGQSGKLLEAEFAAAEPFVVRFIDADGKLDGVCERCNYAANCRHVLAAAMTISRVLHNARFHRDDLPPPRLEAMREQLKAPVSEEARPKVIFSSDGPGGRFALDYDSGKREASWISAGPSPGMEWLAWQDRQPERVAEAFGQWLSAKPEEVEIEVRSAADTLSFAEVSWRRMRARTELRLEGRAVNVRRVVGSEVGEEAVADFIDLGYGLVVLPSEAVFARVEPHDAWQEASRVLASGTSDTSRPVFSLSAAAFNTEPPAWPAPNFTLLDDEGQPVPARETPCRGLLIAETGGETVRIRLRACDAEGRELPFQPSLNRCFDDYTVLMKSPARRRRLGEGLCRLLRGEEKGEGEVESILLELSRDAAFTSYEMHGEEAMRCLRGLLERFRQMNAGCLLADPASPGKPESRWLACAGLGSSLGEALAVVIELFAGEELLRSKDFSFETGAPGFIRELPKLVEACAQQQIVLRVDDRKVRAAKLNLSVRAIQSGVIDWFELHPEARAGNLAIAREQWGEILRTGRFRADDDTLVSVDEESLNALRRLNGLLDSSVGDAEKVPRLRLFDWVALRAEGVACEVPPEEEAVLASLQNLERIPAQALPLGFCGEMREYQQHGYSWLAFLYRHRFGACLADDMGLGKTIQTIALLAAIVEGGIPSQAPSTSREPHLVVLPPTLLFNWQSEIARFAPGLKVYEYTGQGRSADFAGADVILTTYGLASRDIETLSSIGFDVVVFDEAQAIKNATAARTRALGRLKARFRICLTGTPLENHIGEFHSIMEAAVPGVFGERKRFLEQHEAGLPVLARAKPFLLRRTKERILAELPPKVERDTFFHLSERQKECYTRAVGEVHKEVLAAYGERPAQQAGIIALAALLRLRQICISPAMLSDEMEESSPKLDYLVEQLAALAEEGHAALVFSQFVKALDLVGRVLEKAGLPFLRMDGSTPTARRKELVEAFQSGESPGIFLISLKTGGAGLNLPRASYIYHLDPWWNPAVEAQANARAHRIGQKNGVYVQRLLMHHTVEEKMMALKERKQALFDEVVEHGGAASLNGAPTLTADDFRFLVEM